MRLVFQPVFDAADSEIVGVEALLRWDSRKFGEVAPAEFIPIAEETGVIVPLGAWVLRESCETIVRISRETGRTLELGVNISAHQVARSGFARAVRQTLAHAEFPANLLTLEITESGLLRPDAAMLHTIAELEELGVRIVLDDLGTGLLLARLASPASPPRDQDRPHLRQRPAGRRFETRRSSPG